MARKDDEPVGANLSRRTFLKSTGVARLPLVITISGDEGFQYVTAASR